MLGDGGLDRRRQHTGRRAQIDVAVVRRGEQNAALDEQLLVTSKSSIIRLTRSWSQAATASIFPASMSASSRSHSGGACRCCALRSSST